MIHFPDAAPLERLCLTLAKLRSPEGCPWDKIQTHSSMKEFLIEECAELLDAIDDNDPSGMCEELGDLLMHVIFHAQMAQEKGLFDFDEVIKGVTEKLIRRHPHVFAGEKAENPEQVLDIWREVKSKEKGGIGASPRRFSRIPRHLPALNRARDYQIEAAKAGFDWSSQEQILDKVEEELRELRCALAAKDDDAVDDEIGDLLFSVVNLSRFRGRFSAEELLARTVKKFKRRFEHIENELARQGVSPEQASIEQMEELWDQAKKAEIGTFGGKEE
ncbi:MAG: nucleoside triphosphate pyrophosphohydrolase [Victivallales bacterium]|nr:nucleoside triphosphate pyrophosphohydrolase [Victivallales bacterium]